MTTPTLDAIEARLDSYRCVKSMKYRELNAIEDIATLLAIARAAEQALETLVLVDAAINPPDRGGIALHEWNERLKNATEAVRSTKETLWKALGIWKGAPSASPR